MNNEKQNIMIGKECLKIYMDGMKERSYNVLGAKISKPDIMLIKNEYLEKYATEREKDDYLKYIESDRFLKSANPQLMNDPSVMKKFYEDFLKSKDTSVLDHERKFSYINRYLSRYGTKEDFDKISLKLEEMDTINYSVCVNNNQNINIKKSGKYELAYRTVLRMNNDNEINDYLEKTEIVASSFMGTVQVFMTGLKLMDELEKIQIEARLKEIASNFSQYMQQKVEEKKMFDANLKRMQEVEKEQKHLAQANLIIKDLIGSGAKSIEEYANGRHLDIKGMEFFLKTVKDFNPDLYNKYVENMREVKAVKMSGKKAYKDIIDSIATGITVDGVKYNYDLIDYFKSTDLSLEDFELYIKENKGYTARDRKVFSEFRKKKESFSIKENELKRIINSYTEIDFKEHDAKGLPIRGTGRIVTEEEKLAIFDYLRENNIPLTSKVYKDAFNRFKEDRLFDKEKVQAKALVK